MKYRVKLSVSAGLIVMLSAAHGISQTRSRGEAGRGFPYASGDDWSACLGMGVAILVLGILIGVAGAVWDALDGHVLHVIPLAIVTVLGARGLAGALFRDGDYPIDGGLVGFMLIPSFVVVGLLYVVIVKQIQISRDKRRGE